MKKYTRLFLHSIITMVLCIGIATAMHDKDYSEQMLKSSGSHESSTGAPGEKTCTQSGCHDMCEIIKDDTTNALYVGDSSGYYTDNLAPIRLVVRKDPFVVIIRLIKPKTYHQEILRMCSTLFVEADLLQQEHNGS